MPTAFQLRTLPEILSQMFATARVLQGDDVDLNVGSLIRTMLEAAALQDAEQYIQIARLLDLFSIDEAVGDDLDERAKDYGAEIFDNLRRRGAQTSITQLVVGDGTLAVSSKLVANIAAGVSSFSVTVGEGALFPASGAGILERGKLRQEEVVYTRVGDVFTVVTPADGLVNPHLILGTFEQLATKSILNGAIIVGASAATVETGTGATWPASGSIIFERDTVRREIFTFTRVGDVFTLTSGTTAFAHADLTDVLLSTNGSDRAIAVNTIAYVSESFATKRINYRTTAAATLLDGDLTSALINAESEDAGAQTLAGANTVSAFSSAPFANATVTNPFAATRGRDRENDDAFLERLRNFVQSLSRGTGLAIEENLVGTVDEFSGSTVAFAEIVEPVAPGESQLYITDGTVTFSVDFEVKSGRDVLITDADTGDARTRLNELGPFKETPTPVVDRTPRIFKSTERGEATSVGADFLEDTTQGMTIDEHIGRYLKTDDNLFYKITANSAIRFTIDASGGTPSLGAYSVFEFGVARGVLTFGGIPVAAELVTIDGKAYQFTSPLGAVDGDVLIGASASDSLDNLIAAITLGAGSGVAYAAATTLHPTATAEAGVGDTMDTYAKDGGVAGNSITTTTNVTLGSWAAAVLEEGVDPLIPGTDYGFNQSNGELELVVPLVANDALVAADDGAQSNVGAYTYSRGLAAHVQRLVNGDKSDPQTYPGLKSTGTMVRVVAPTVVSTTLTIQVITTSGFTDATLEGVVKAIVQAYVNSLGMGENIILSEIIRLVKGLVGVSDVRMISPTANVPVADGQLARITDGNVVVV